MHRIARKRSESKREREKNQSSVFTLLFFTLEKIEGPPINFRDKAKRQAYHRLSHSMSLSLSLFFSTFCHMTPLFLFTTSTILILF